MRELSQDLRFGLRLLKANPGFTVVAVLTLAIGISANTTVFSWIDGLLLRPYPGANNPERLALLEMINPSAPNGGIGVSFPNYRDFRAQLKSASGLAAHIEAAFSVGEGTNAQALWGELVSANYFEVLGVEPQIGRLSGPDDSDVRVGANPVVFISHNLWRTRFQSDPKVIGKTVRVSGRILTVAAVTPPEFRGTFPGLSLDLWVPLTMAPELGMARQDFFGDRGAHALYCIARLAPGATVEQARAETETVARRLASAYPRTNSRMSAVILRPWQSHRGVGDLLLKPLRILMAVAIVLLLIVCANIGNLILVRSIARQKEFAVRIALGAGRGRLIRQLLTEAALLAAGGALVSLPICLWMAEMLPALVPKIGFSVASGFQFNVRLLLFTIAVCAATALISGVAPALFAFRRELNETLKEGGRSGTAGAASHRARAALVAAEMALAAIALIGAGLFVRSFENARNIHPGFDRNNMLLARYYLAGTGYTTQQTLEFCARLQERLEATHGVSAVNYADFAPLGSSGGPYHGIEIAGYVPARGESMNVNRYLVAAGWFAALRTPVLEGREFLESDDGTAPPVLMVNEAFARRYFNGSNPVGRKVRCWGRWATIVGMAQDAKYFDVADAAKPHFFAPFKQQYSAGGQLYLFIRTAGDPAPAVAALRREAAALDPNATAYHVMPFIAWTEVTLLAHKVAASLLASLAMLSLLLAAVGLYSVMAYAVEQRTQEIGVRMALGARPRDVLREVLWRGTSLAAVGLIAGTLAAFAATRVVASMLIGIGAADPATFGAAALFLTAVALLATYIPARRATKVSPMTALRCE